LISKEFGKPGGDDKITIGVGLIFFNDYSSLKRCLNSIYDLADIIFAIDGRFPTFPGYSEFSTDGSRELVKSYPNVLLVDCPKPEFEKREKYLEYCALYSVDILLIIDSDEFVLNGDCKTFRRNLKTVIFDRDKCICNVYTVMLQNLDNSEEFTPYPRVWYNPVHMEYYAGRHYCFRSKEQKNTNISGQSDLISKFNLESIKLGHDHSLRSKYHLQSRSIYQRWLVDFERSLP
jgi:hypothetical protein